MAFGQAIEAGGAFLRFFVDKTAADEALASFESRWDKFASKFAKIGTQWSAMGAAMLAIPALGVTSFATLESSLLIVKGAIADNATGVGEVESSMKRLHQIALDLGEATLKNAQEVAEGMKALAINDFSGPEIEIAIKPVVDYAELAGVTVPESAAIINQILKNQKFPNTEAGTVADMLAVVSRKNNKLISEFMTGQGNMGGLLATAGVPLEEQLAFLTLAMEMMDPSRAGTGMRAALSSILDPATKKKMAQVNGLDFEDGGNFSFIQLLKSLEAKTAGMTNIEKAKYIGSIFDQRQEELMADLIGMSAKLEERIQQFREPGALGKTLGEQRTGTGFAMDVVESSYDTMKVNWGEAMKEDVKVIARILADLLHVFADFIRAHPNVIRAFTGIAATIASFGAVMLGMAAGAKLAGMLGTLVRLAAIFPTLAVGVGLAATGLLGLNVPLVQVAGVGFIFHRVFHSLVMVVLPKLVWLVGMVAVTAFQGLSVVVGLVWSGISALYASCILFVPEILAVGLAVGVLIAAFYLLYQLIPAILDTVFEAFSGIGTAGRAFAGGFYDSIAETMGMVKELLLDGQFADAATTMWTGIKLAFYEGLKSVFDACIGLQEFLSTFIVEIGVQSIQVTRGAQKIAQASLFWTVGENQKFDLETEMMVKMLRAMPSDWVGSTLDQRITDLKKERQAGMDRKAEREAASGRAELWYVLAGLPSEYDEILNYKGGGGRGGKDDKPPPPTPFEFSRRLGSLGKYELGKAEGDNLVVDLLSPGATGGTPMDQLVVAAKETAKSVAKLRDIQIVGVMET